MPTIELGELQHTSLHKHDYHEQLASLQVQLMALQIGLYKSGKRAIIVVEGTDSAGKGGMIRRLVDKMDPRGFRVYPIGPPSPEELSRHYLQRFWRRIPQAGQLAIFDRSWYGRVLVERVESLTPEPHWRRAYKEINDFEDMLADDDHILIKVFLSIDKDEQLKRLKKRFQDPNKRWKLTHADLDGLNYWDSYQSAYEDMLQLTNGIARQWHLIPANDKLFARINALTHIRDQLAEHIDLNTIELMPKDVYARAQSIFGEKG